MLDSVLTGACCAGAHPDPEAEATASAVNPAPSLSTAALLAQLDAEDAELSEADISAFLPEAIAHLARMLEPMLHNADTAAMFVEEGGVPALLQLYKWVRQHKTSSRALHQAMLALAVQGMQSIQGMQRNAKDLRRFALACFALGPLLLPPVGSFMLVLQAAAASAHLWIHFTLSQPPGSISVICCHPFA